MVELGKRSCEGKQHENSSQAPPEHPWGLLLAAVHLELCAEGHPEHARDKAPEGHIVLDKLLMQNNLKLPLMLQRRTEIRKIFPFCHVALGQETG